MTKRPAWHDTRKKPDAAVIDDFVRRRRGEVREGLIAYALQARTGMIL